MMSPTEPKVIDMFNVTSNCGNKDHYEVARSWEQALISNDEEVCCTCPRRQAMISRKPEIQPRLNMIPASPLISG